MEASALYMCRSGAAGHFLCTTDEWSIRDRCKSYIVYHLHLTLISLLGSKSHHIRKAKYEKQHHAEMPGDCPKALRPLLLPVLQKREFHNTPESDTFCMNLHLTQRQAAQRCGPLSKRLREIPMRIVSVSLEEHDRSVLMGWLGVWVLSSLLGSSLLLAHGVSAGSERKERPDGLEEMPYGGAANKDNQNCSFVAQEA
ncbi:hypothetical protein IRJ41_013378 [Triplophysa rosa]|uniref:Uncharacterized protein n=1 Tax=Triplophysa rosa TaxID=992332 RepID=A0A9W7TGK6_TRIRA|nr:hypothetical protein IRJ41_013378 [Triplophysa rosa]